MKDYEHVDKMEEGELEDRRAGRLLLHRAFYCSLPDEAPPVQTCEQQGLTPSQYADTFTAWELVDAAADKAAVDAYRASLADFFTHGLDFSKDAVVQATDPSSAFHDQAIQKNKQPRPKVLRELWASLTDLTIPESSKYKQQSDAKRSDITNSLVFFALDTVSALHQLTLVTSPLFACITYAVLVVCCTALSICYHNAALTADLCSAVSTLAAQCALAMHLHLLPYCSTWSFTDIMCYTAVDARVCIHISCAFTVHPQHVCISYAALLSQSRSLSICCTVTACYRVLYCTQL